MEAALAPSGAVRYKPTGSGLNQSSPRALLACVSGAVPGFANGDTRDPRLEEHASINHK